MPHLDKRKLIRNGKCSLAVILPKAWLDYYNLKYGDEVQLISNDEIKITPIKKDLKKEGVV